jgi:Zn-dependent M28 family amino/carboxypeptidase
MGHYDSVLNSPGASDDVHAVANMLEVARLLKEEELENDVIFLITDGEELGLFTAT